MAPWNNSVMKQFLSFLQIRRLSSLLHYQALEFYPPTVNGHRSFQNKSIFSACLVILHFSCILLAIWLHCFHWGIQGGTHLSTRLDFDAELTCIPKGSEANLKGSTLKLCILWQQEALIQPHNDLAKIKLRASAIPSGWKASGITQCPCTWCAPEHCVQDTLEISFTKFHPINPRHELLRMTTVESFHQSWILLK